MMNKIYRIGISFVLTLTMLIGMAAVCQAAPSTSGFSVSDVRITNDLNKAWTIQFNGQLAADTVNNNTVYIVDSDSRSVAASLSISGDKSAVTIKPVSPYTVGNKYWLYVTSGVCRQSSGGEAVIPLSEPLVMPFIIAQDGYIQSIGNVYNTLLTDLSVSTNAFVHSVSINGTNMLYQGKNKFELGVAGLARSTKMIVNAYDSSGNLLQTLEYTIN